MNSEKTRMWEYKKNNRRWIYVINAFHPSYKPGDYKNRVEPRAFGLFFQLKKANWIVKNNIGSIDECGYYQYVCIEQIPAGIHGLAVMRYWFEWNGKKYVPCKNPYGEIPFVNLSPLG